MKKVLTIIAGVLLAGGVFYFVVNVNSNISTSQNKTDVENMVANTGLGSVVTGNSSVEYNIVTNNGNNPGVMVGKLEVNSHKVTLNDKDKGGILKWISQNKSDEIRITYSPNPLEARKLALSIRDFLVSENYKVLYPEQVQLGGGICEFVVCFANEGKSIHVN